LAIGTLYGARREENLVVGLVGRFHPDILTNRSVSRNWFGTGKGGIKEDPGQRNRGVELWLTLRFLP